MGGGYDKDDKELISMARGAMQGSSIGGIHGAHQPYHNTAKMPQHADNGHYDESRSAAPGGRQGWQTSAIHAPTAMNHSSMPASHMHHNTASQDAWRAMPPAQPYSNDGSSSLWHANSSGRSNGHPPNNGRAPDDMRHAPPNADWRGQPHGGPGWGGEQRRGGSRYGWN